MNEPTQWYYAKDGTQVGPLTEAQLYQLAKSGGLSPDDLVWHAGLGSKWVSSKSIPALLSEFQVGSESQPDIQPQPNVQTSPHLPRSNAEITKLARGALKDRWAPVLGIYLVSLILLIGVSIGLVFCQQIVEGIAGKSPFLEFGTQLIQWVIQAPFSLSFSFLSLRISRGLPTKVPMVFQGFAYFWKACATYLLIFLFTVLWSLLLIVPGIVAGLSYSMAWYILCDEPAVGPLEAIRRSKALMRGHKWRCFCLLCRFLGWAVLCIFTLGIGFLWLVPYMGTCIACFYNDLRGRTPLGVPGT
jgi:uncharacterized membrane protein